MRAALQTKPKASSNATPTFTPARSCLLQRKCACGGTPGPTGECDGCRKKKLPRRSENLDLSSISDPPSSVSGIPPSVNEVLRSPGQPLEEGTRAFMEPRFGHDFSSVRLHTDELAAKAAARVGARAYTTNEHIVFGAAEYRPHTKSGVHLLSHELSHVVQQREGIHLTDNIGREGDEYERQAEALAARVTQGGLAGRLSPAGLTPPSSRASAVIQFKKGDPLHKAGGGLDPTSNPAAGAMERARLLAQKENIPHARAQWTADEIKAIQGELIRLGLYHMTADGKLGSYTEIGLVEAFGGDEWRALSASVALTRLKKAKSSGGKRGEHAFRYGEMFKDGLLDITLGLGFDPSTLPKTALNNFVNEMTKLSFKNDKNLAAALYKKAGRALTPNAFGEFFVSENALNYTPPAGAARKINAVVRLVYSLQGGEGKQAATAFKEGMVSSDVAYYSGHGRYGSGPDFDYDAKFLLLAQDGTIEQNVADYHALGLILASEGKAHQRSAWDQFLWRVNNKRIDVIPSTEGNIVLSKEPKHQDEFGGKLLYWSLNRKGGKGAPQVTGGSGQLATKARSETQRKYRVVVFDGCRTKDYEKSVRATPGFDVQSADVLATKRTLEWGDEGPTLAKFLNSIIKMQSAEEIVRNMDAEQHVKEGRQWVVKLGAYGAYGIEDNPVIK
jgi:hypothetical protein